MNRSYNISADFEQIYVDYARHSGERISRLHMALPQRLKQLTRYIYIFICIHVCSPLPCCYLCLNDNLFGIAHTPRNRNASKQSDFHLL